MPDYAAMYKRLYQSQTRAIKILQEAQQDAEEMYISAPDTNIQVFEIKKPADETDGKNK